MINKKETLKLLNQIKENINKIRTMDQMAFVIWELNEIEEKTAYLIDSVEKDYDD